jgi:hypothetical protein
MHPPFAPTPVALAVRLMLRDMIFAAEKLR